MAGEFSSCPVDHQTIQYRCLLPAERWTCAEQQGVVRAAQRSLFFFNRGCFHGLSGRLPCTVRFGRSCSPKLGQDRRGTTQPDRLSAWSPPCVVIVSALPCCERQLVRVTLPCMTFYVLSTLVVLANLQLLQLSPVTRTTARYARVTDV